MRVRSFYHSIRVRLGLLIALAMVALVGYLIYDQIQEHSEEEERARESLERLALFAASAERTQLDATENFFVIVKQAESFTKVAATPDDQAAYDACTRGLYISDQLVPGTRFSLWDLEGNSLCSSRGAKRGEFSAANSLWFQQTKERQGFATGEFELLDGTGAPTLPFGAPIVDPATNQVVAYLSGAVEVEHARLLPTGESLPDTGRLTVIDQDGTVIVSTGREPGEQRTLPASFAALSGYRDSSIEQGSGRTGAAVRITDGDDALVAVVVSAEDGSLASPLANTLFRLLIPIALLTLTTLLAVWLLAQRWIVRPIEELGAASDALASGELGARANIAPGLSELDDLVQRFNEMAETRQRASQAKDDFLGLVSHELKTPITMTLGNAEILRNRGDQLDPEQRRAALEDIHESTLRLAAIVDNLLVLARMERGVGLDNEPLSLMSMTQTVAQRQARRAPGRRVSVTGDATVLALGGQTYVEQVIQNLVGNALKYSPKDQPVDVTVEQSAGSAVVRVFDRGPGIAPAELDAIFQPFYRSDRTANVAEGIGIGLSVCKRLVEAMDGAIWAKERSGGGTEFGFSLPLAADDAATAPSTEQLIPATT
jgi:signal transduction histidine kinase